MTVLLGRPAWASWLPGRDEMWDAMWDCEHCGCLAIAAGLEKCPHCQEERDMPKATAGGGPSNGAPPGERSVPEPEVPAAGTPEPAAGAAPEMPGKGAGKAEWAAYAVAMGADEGEAARMTKAALIAAHGPGGG